MIKVPRDEYNILKNKIRYLEYYWSEYRRRHRNSRDFEDARSIRRFIKANRYELLTDAKYNRFSRTYSLSSQQYVELKKYARIARNLELILNIDNLSE